MGGIVKQKARMSQVYEMLNIFESGQNKVAQT